MYPNQTEYIFQKLFLYASDVLYITKEARLQITACIFRDTSPLIHMFVHKAALALVHFGESIYYKLQQKAHIVKYK